MNAELHIPDKVCRNHPDRAAVTRCETCFKPLCEECKQQLLGKTFCSDQCARSWHEVDRNIAEFEQRRRHDVQRRWRKRMVRWALLTALAASVWYYLTKHPEQVQYWLDQARHLLHRLKLNQ